MKYNVVNTKAIKRIVPKIGHSLFACKKYLNICSYIFIITPSEERGSGVGYRRNDTMEKMISKAADAAEKYELMSDGIVAELEDKLFVMFTYGPESTYYLAEVHSGRIVAAISMFEGCKCVLAYDENEGWRIDAIDENGNKDGSIRLCRTGIDLGTMGEAGRKNVPIAGDVAKVTTSDFREADDHDTDCRRGRDLRQNDKRA